MANKENLNAIKLMQEDYDWMKEVRLVGIDRVVPMGQTMDFDFIWDGYNLYELF